jgi:hypothetical protein
MIYFPPFLYNLDAQSYISSPYLYVDDFHSLNLKQSRMFKVGTGCKEAGEKIMLVTFLVIYNIYSWRRWRFFLS